MRFKLAIVFLLLIKTSLSAQDSFQNQLQMANQAYQNANYSGALEMFTSLKESGDATAEISSMIECSIGISKSCMAMGQFDHAISECTDAINSIKGAESVSGEQQAMLHKLLGEAYLNDGLNEQALQKLNIAASFISDKKSLFYADIMEETGVAYLNSGNDQLAQEHLDIALQTRSQLLPEDHELIADSYTNLALVVLEEDYFNTLIYLKKALNIYEKKFGTNNLKVANVYFNLGMANLLNKTFTQSTNYFNNVKEIYEAVYDSNHPNNAIIEATLARIDYELGYYDKAVEKFESALKIYKSNYGEKHPEVADTYGRIGESYRKNSDFKNSLLYYQKAIYANLRDQEYESVRELPTLEKYFNPEYLLRALQAKAIALEELHYNKTLKPKDINAALDTYILCDSLVSRLKQIRLSEEDKIKMSALSNEIYEDGIRISIDISNRSINKKYYYNLAYQFFERSKASTLHEAINDTEAKNYAGIPTDVLDKETSLIEEIVVLENKLIEKGNDAATEKALSSQLFDKNTEYRNFITNLEQNYPSYFELKYKTNLATPEQIQERLSDQEAIVSYFISVEGENDENVNLFIMSLGKKKLSFYQVPLPENFFNLIKGFRNAIKFKSAAATTKIGKQLFGLLFPAELYERYNFFTVIPDGALGTIPFEALQDDNNQFVIETKNINYDFSANLYLGNLKQKKSDQKNILAVAPVSFDKYTSVKLSQLPGTIREVEQLRKVSEKNNISTSLWTNRQASETEFKSASLGEYDIIHFATHGEVNESQPNLSRIFLSPDADNNDGFLYSSEIYNLNLNADLVTLSACETGLGKVAKGEGIIGLSRSLKYAGSKNLIVSLWKVADQSTSDLMISFYEKQQEAQSTYARALRDAKLSLLYSSEYTEPYYWAPFILIGK
ncbi:MAG: CHAT domain-containing tetratricopeptide repeat protein [Bacteroidota bacterium]